MTGQPRRWTGVHCFLHLEPPDVDAFLTDAVAPTLDRMRADGRIADRFFIRYADGGPHLRIRVADAAPDVERRLTDELTRLVATAPDTRTPAVTPSVIGSGWQPHGTVLPVEYVPEVDRYGGPAAIAVAETAFCRSTDVALSVLATRPSTRARLAVAVDLIIATALTLGLDRLATVRWLRAYAAGWRRQTDAALLPPSIGETRTVAIFDRQADALRQTWSRIERLVSAAPDGDDPVAKWVSTIRWARHALDGTAGSGPEVWASHLHMLLNRLGVVPEEERSLCRLVAAIAALPDGIVPFFTDGVTAVDRAYHEASKYLPGQLDTQRPRDVRPSLRRSPHPVARPALPHRDLGPETLADALRHRRSGRGVFRGPVTASDLGTLIRSAYGATRDAERLPYPSGGRQYAARLRLVVRDIPGVEPGTYDVDPHDPAPRRIGPKPSTVDLEATSMWFGAGTVAFGGLDISAAPAMLGLFTHLAGRPRYGLRAMRFALVEAGHLAQNLALVAAATGLELGLIGGFYDDLANDLFGLDGTDRFVVYLLPLGRRPPAT